MEMVPLRDHWALVLGASSGFGEATALELAQTGMHLFGVHLDGKSTLSNVERIMTAIKETGRKAVFFNMNAADEERRREAVKVMEKECKATGTQVRILLHSLAFGTLKPYMGEEKGGRVIKSQMEMTLDVMAHSLVYWVQELVERKLMGRFGRILAMTSAGSEKVWKYYGPVSAAKAALESHIRQLALELAPAGITANAIRAGVTDTPALRKIPGHEKMVEMGRMKNPSGRLTTPRDVARAIVALSQPETYWMTGNVIGIDGGEFCSEKYD